MKTSRLIATILIGMMGLQIAGAQNKSIHPSKTFRIVIEKMDSTVEKGMLEEIKDSSIVMGIKTNGEYLLKEFPYSKLNIVKIRRTARIGRGALIGLGSGIIIGGVTGKALHKEEDYDGWSLIIEPISETVDIMAGCIFGGIAGGLAGAAIGSANTVYFINGNYNGYKKIKNEMISLVSDNNLLK